MARARRLRFASRVLEGLVWLIVAGSVAAIGAVHPWAYVPLWLACLVAALLVAVRTATLASLKRSLGPQRQLSGCTITRASGGYA